LITFLMWWIAIGVVVTLSTIGLSAYIYSFAPEPAPKDNPFSKMLREKWTVFVRMALFWPFTFILLLMLIIVAIAAARGKMKVTIS
jgi:hypothetical protein